MSERRCDICAVELPDKPAEQPHWVELGYTKVYRCCPCFAKARKSAHRDWAKKAQGLKEQYVLFLEGQ